MEDTIYMYCSQTDHRLSDPSLAGCTYACISTSTSSLPHPAMQPYNVKMNVSAVSRKHSSVLWREMGGKSMGSPLFPFSSFCICVYQKACTHNREDAEPSQMIRKKNINECQSLWHLLVNGRRFS